MSFLSTHVLNIANSWKRVIIFLVIEEYSMIRIPTKANDIDACKLFLFKKHDSANTVTVFQKTITKYRLHNCQRIIAEKISTT